LEAYPDVLRNAFADVKATHDQDKSDQKIIAAFNKAGYKDVVLLDRSKTLPEQPNVTVLDYRRWMTLGRKVKAGERALKIRGYSVRLFHKSQTDIATTAERKAYHKQEQDRAAKHEAKASAQPQG
jgi:hypothetical protein